MTEDFDGFLHRPVLYHQILHALRPTNGGFYVDGTLGAGGHAWGILQACSPDGCLLGLDVDPRALRISRRNLESFGSRAIIVQADYTTLGEQLEALNWSSVNGILLDLGVSSMQLDEPGRGFSFRVDDPLDMRYDPANPVQAADLVNTLSEAELTSLLYDYGEEKYARHIARAIVKARPLRRTQQLAQVIEREVGRQERSRGKNIWRKVRLHPATRTFQAFRIAVNHELEKLEEVLPQALTSLATGGRLAVISFHSLEDRIVKNFIRRESQVCICPPRQPICTCGHRAVLTEVTRRPLRPKQAELQQNPRSRSARLRVAEKIAQNMKDGPNLNY